MPRRGRNNSRDEEEDAEATNARPRRGATKTVNYANDGVDDDGGDVPMEDAEREESDAEQGDNPASSEEMDDDMEEEDAGVAHRRSGRSRTATNNEAAAKQSQRDSSESRRTSSRANKFKDSMKEPSSTSIRDLVQDTQTTSKGKSKAKTNKRKTNSRANSFDDDDDDDDDDDSIEEVTRAPPKQRGKPRSKKGSAKAASPTKSPARRHRQARTNKSHAETEESSSEESNPESDEYDEVDDYESDEEHPFKIQRIIASKTAKRNEWTKLCAKMNTTEIDYGSRWVQDPADEDDATFEERFLVKWSDMSYLHLSWETESDLLDLVEGAKTYLTTFFRKSSHGLLFSADERCDGDYFDPAWTQVDRILELHFPDECPCKSVKDEDTVTPDDLGMIFDKSNPDFPSGVGRELLVKWGNCPYTETTYEYERDLILNDVEYKDALKDFQSRSKKLSKDKANRLQKKGETEKKRLYKDVFGDNGPQKSEEAAKEYQEKLEEHIYKNGGKLRDYQAEGVAWMMNNYINGRGSILADEMGLGKTIQTATFINLLATDLHRTGPFLIVAPLSTLAHWQREFTGWTNLNTIVYHGSAHDRELIREMEFAFESSRPSGGVGFNQLYLRKCRPKRGSDSAGNPWMVEVVITTPELLTADDFVELTAVEWEAIVVDEAHRLKTHTSKFSTNLRDSRFDFHHKLLLTGTPIQNDVNEFWTLLNFVSPDSFDDCQTFMEKYGEMKNKESIDALHEEIRPYILRRLKEDVEKSVPPKEETLIEVELTVAQKQYYRALYEKNVKFLHKNKKKALDGPSLNNLAMQLRKCCNHLFLLNGIEEEFRVQTLQEEKDVTEGDLLVKASGKLVLLDKLLPRLKQDGHRILMFSQFKIMLDVLEDYLNERSMKFERIDGSITGKQRQQAIDRYQAPQVEGKESPFIMLLSTRAGGVGINLTAADTCIIFDSDWNPQNDLQAQARCHRIGQTKSVKVYRLLTSKTYEMQMFHVSSLKMGLDQAVLKGFESGSSGEGALTKEEVENLLRRGAYDIFSESQDGSGEAESNDFVQQDIDTILERRSRTVVHENTGSNSNAAGGTFSKARFSAASTPSGVKKGLAEDVDIEDPEFWKKMVGEGPAEDPGDLPEKRRVRTVQNYSEKGYDKRFNSSLLDSGAEEDDGSDGDSGDESDYDESEMRERYRWGGNKANEWKKDQAKKIIHQLQSHGYGMLSWDNFFKEYGVKQQDHKEVNRFCWAVVLTALHEAANDDAVAAKRRADRAAEKKREAAGQDASKDGGVLGVAPAAGTETNDKAIQSCFNKLWAENASWLDNVLKDAQDYAQHVQPRSDELLHRVFHTGQAPLPPTEVSTMFVQNVWPSLKSRGWKAELVTDGPHAGKTQYSYEGKQYWTPEAVLAAAGGIHPELSNMVESLSKAAASSRQKTEESEAITKAQHLAMTSGNIDVDVLGEFLRKYAPLQLVFDRKSHKRLHLSRKTLTACSFVHAAGELQSRLEKSRGDSSLLAKMSSFLSPLFDKRFARPHQLWSSQHDAVLIHAIAKHGWIDSEASVRKIIEDTDIKWGFPFDSDDAAQESTNSDRVSQRDEMIAKLRATASRAANFLNVHSDLTEDMKLKGFDMDLLIRTFSLERDAENSENEHVEEGQPNEKNAWVVDDDALVKSTGLSNTESSEPEELPPKKVLVKRAKMVLTRALGATEASGAAAIDSESAEQSKSQSRFPILDQSDKCNLFLAEVFRMILKAPYPKMGRQIRLLLSIAAEEAGKLRSEDLLLHVGFVKRSLKKAVQAKNVLRAILGLDVHGSEPHFPDEGSATSPSRQGTLLNGSKGKKDDAAVGDRAVSRAMKRVFDAHGGPVSAVSPEGHNSDLELTAVETLIISVLCSVGLPVWTQEWEALLFDDDEDDMTGAKDRFTLVWQGVGNVLKSAASNWYEAAMKKHSVCRVECEKYDTQDQDSQAKTRAVKARESAEREEHVKKIAAGQAADFAGDPLTLAKKSIMLTERLRVKGLGTAAGNSKGTKKLNNGLGNKVLQWVGQQLCTWAKALDIVDASGKTLSYTAIDFYHDIPREDREMIYVSASFTKQDCRHVLTQVAQLTRSRSLFLTQSRDCLVTKFERAAKNSRIGDEWESRPSWWGIADGATTYSVCHDVLLLESLIDYGFGGVLEHAKGFGLPSETDEESSQSTLKELGVVKYAIQQRANQLTRELHALEESDDLIRMLGERKAVRQALAESQDNTITGKKKGASSSSKNGKKQKSLHTFFASKNSAPASVVVLSDDSDSDDPAQQKPQPKAIVNNENSGEAMVDDEVEVVAASSSCEKRSESDMPAADGVSPSPEKKLRVV